MFRVVALQVRTLARCTVPTTTAAATTVTTTSTFSTTTQQQNKRQQQQHNQQQAQKQRMYATGGEDHSVYEFRTYSIKPEHYPSFLQLTNEHIHKRTKHSTLLGYWMTELGGVNEVVHLWQYDDLAHRASVRAALVKDTDWMDGYMKPMRPMLQKQENIVLENMYPWHLFAPPRQLEDQSIYEISLLKVKPGSRHEWEESTKDVLPEMHQLKGIWYSTIGQNHTLLAIEQWSDFTTREMVRTARAKNATFRLWRELSSRLIVDKQSKIVLPAGFSPWQ